VLFTFANACGDQYGSLLFKNDIVKKSFVIAKHYSKSFLDSREKYSNLMIKSGLRWSHSFT